MRSRLVGHVNAGQCVERRIDQARALLVEVGQQAGLHQLVVAACDVEHAQVGAELVDDAAIAQRGVAHVPFLVVVWAAAVAAVGIRRPDVVGAAGVADEVQAAVPPHRALVVRRVVLEQRRGFALGAKVKAPQLRMGAAAVGLHVIVGQGQAHAREVDRAAAVVEHGVVGVGQRQHAALQVAGLSAATMRCLAGPVELSVLTRTSPCGVQPSTDQAAVFEGDPLGQAAFDRHHIGFLRAFVRGREGDQLAVVGERRMGFGARVGGQALRLAAAGGRCATGRPRR